MGLRYRACVAVSHPRERHVAAELCLLRAHVPVWGGQEWEVHPGGPTICFLGIRHLELTRWSLRKPLGVSTSREHFSPPFLSFMVSSPERMVP